MLIKKVWKNFSVVFYMNIISKIDFFYYKNRWKCNIRISNGIILKVLDIKYPTVFVCSCREYHTTMLKCVDRGPSSHTRRFKIQYLCVVRSSQQSEEWWWGADARWPESIGPLEGCDDSVPNAPHVYMEDVRQKWCTLRRNRIFYIYIIFRIEISLIEKQNSAETDGCKGCRRTEGG